MSFIVFGNVCSDVGNEEIHVFNILDKLFHLDVVSLVERNLWKTINKLILVTLYHHEVAIDFVYLGVVDLKSVLHVFNYRILQKSLVQTVGLVNDSEKGVCKVRKAVVGVAGTTVVVL